MTLRKCLFWLHLTAGCLAGAVILLMSFTGVLLMYERQMLAWFDRGNYTVPVQSDAQPIPLSELLATVRLQNPQRITPQTTVTIRAGATDPIELGKGREGAVYVNPYTGSLLGSGSPAAHQFFQKVTGWHRWFAVEGPGRATARAITGACNLAFLFIVVSGAWLWLPRQWSWQHIRPITWFRGGLAGKARDFNWHNVLGLWSFIPLFVVVLTALPMSYPWATDLLYKLTATQAPAPVRGPGGPPPGNPNDKPVDLTNIDALWSVARQQVPGWRAITFRLPDSPQSPIAFTIDQGSGGQPQARSTLTLHRLTAEPIRWEKFSDNNAGRRLRMWSRFLHTGEALGLIGQTLAGLASAGAVVLVWTGISLSLRRFSAWRARETKRESVAA